MTRFATTEYTDYTSPKCHAFTRITAHTAFTAAQTPTNPAFRAATGTGTPAPEGRAIAPTPARVADRRGYF